MIGEQGELWLVEGLRKNDRDSLAAAYDAYGAIAYGLALKLLGSRTEAEDVVQDSFLALWRQAERIDPARGIRSYLLSIVHNRAVDRIRRSARRPEAELAFDAPIPANDDPVEEVTKITEGEAVRAALVSLPPDQRQTIELVFFRGLTLSETATQMSVPLGTAKSRLRLALGRLRQELGKQ
jgi:RNA polymerase sigma-70 factor (ECF subfamily)